MCVDQRKDEIIYTLNELRLSEQTYIGFISLVYLLLAQRIVFPLKKKVSHILDSPSWFQFQRVPNASSFRSQFPNTSNQNYMSQSSLLSFILFSKVMAKRNRKFIDR